MPSVVYKPSLAATTGYTLDMTEAIADEVIGEARRRLGAEHKIHCDYCQTWQIPILVPGLKANCVACGAPLPIEV